MSRKKFEVIAPEWSHFVEADKIGTAPVKLKLSPNAEERKRLAKRMALTDLKNLESDLVISRDAGSNVIFISGQIHAEVVQPCVITAKPVKSEVQDSFEAWYADPKEAVSFAKAKKEKQEREGEGGEMPFLDESEDPEPVIEGKIDVGELVAQYLSLAINPYPTAEGVELPEEPIKAAAESPIYENPFAALKDWKNKQEKGEG